MKPTAKHITIPTDVGYISKFISEVILEPRINVLAWSKVTKQSPGLKIGYPAQHLASLLTGVEGSRTAARGDDLLDGTEVKACNRIDQLDTCKTCKSKVLRMEVTCSSCSSTDIDRKNDSKWLVTLKTESELELLTKKIDRILLILLDYPKFHLSNFDEARIQAFEIWPKFSPSFVRLLQDYYNNIFLPHIRNNPNKTPAPKNLWPESFQFFHCKPIKTFQCTITSFNSYPSAKIEYFVEPHADRAMLEVERAPIGLLKSDEIDYLYTHHYAEFNKDCSDLSTIWHTSLSHAEKRRLIQLSSERNTVIAGELVSKVPLRDTSKATPHQKLYQRR